MEDEAGLVPREADSAAFTVGTFARISGDLQRASLLLDAKEVADELGLTGWVSEAGSGSINLLVGGDGPAVKFLIRWCRWDNSHPGVETVDTHQASEEELRILPDIGFEIR